MTPNSVVLTVAVCLCASPRSWTCGRVRQAAWRPLRSPTGNGWALQPKYDGLRLLIEVLHGGRVRAWSRHGTSLTGRLGGLEDLVADAAPAERRGRRPDRRH